MGGLLRRAIFSHVRYQVLMTQNYEPYQVPSVKSFNLWEILQLLAFCLFAVWLVVTSVLKEHATHNCSKKWSWPFFQDVGNRQPDHVASHLGDSFVSNI